jgi:F-type H+-transporting ATPase subunit epsilon
MERWSNHTIRNSITPRLHLPTFPRSHLSTFPPEMLTLEIITPDEKVLSSEADQVILPTETGEVGILSGHVPLVTKLVAGELHVLKGSGTEYIAVDKGFAKVLGDTISVLTEAAIDVAEIDLSEVEAAQSRAEEALAEADAEGLDPFELERLEKNVQFLLAQKMAKGRRRR